MELVLKLEDEVCIPWEKEKESEDLMSDAQKDSLDEICISMDKYKGLNLTYFQWPDERHRK